MSGTINVMKVNKEQMEKIKFHLYSGTELMGFICKYHEDVDARGQESLRVAYKSAFELLQGGCLDSEDIRRDVIYNIMRYLKDIGCEVNGSHSIGGYADYLVIVPI